MTRGNVAYPGALRTSYTGMSAVIGDGFRIRIPPFGGAILPHRRAIVAVAARQYHRAACRYPVPGREEPVGAASK